MTGAAHASLLGALPFAVTVLGADGTVLAVNEEAARILGADAEALLGTNFFRDLAPLGGMEQAQDEICRGIERNSVDDWFRTVAVLAGRELRIHVRSFRDGDQGRALVVVEEAGAPRGELRQATEIASRVKHDVNNLLMGLLGHVALLQDRTDLPEPARKKVDLIEQQGKSIRDRITDLDAIRRLGGETRWTHGS